MNPLQSFGNNVVNGAKMLNPGSITRGVKQLGSDMMNTASGLVGKKQMAQKMQAPKAAPQPLKPATNPGFGGYMSYLNQANNN